MCGISAIVEMAPTRAGHIHSLLGMHRSLSHRGPDGEGFLLVDAAMQPHVFRHSFCIAAAEAIHPQLSIGFQRLAIQDPRAEASQPLVSSRGRQWIVLNGEIYNFRELRQRLEAVGYAFRTRGDTEVALAAYDHWGTACFEKFNGMWALLIVDLERGKLVGCRDRLGIKPLFYALDAGRLLLASEPKAIVTALRQGPELQADRFVDFLRGSPQQVAAFSFFEGVHPVPAATFFEMELTGKQLQTPFFEPYWNLADYCAAGPVMSFDKAQQEFAALLESAVSYRTAADVRVGCLLSGGLDSSMLTRLVCGLNNAPHATTQAFSVVFDESDMDESRYIEAVLRLGGIDGRRVRLSAMQAWELIDPVTVAYGEPLLGHYLLAYYRVLGFARQQGIGVILDGQGADELLGGYNPLEAAALREKLNTWRWLDFLRELHMLARQHQRSRRSVLESHVLGYYKSRLITRLYGKSPLHTYAWLCPTATNVAEHIHGVSDCSRDRSLLNRQLYELTKHTNLPYILLFLDRLSMAHGLELRVPYLDHRLVEFCFRQPPAYKIAFGTRKRLLREMAGAYLPRVITERTYKMGIASNLQWLPRRTQHAGALRDMVGSTTMQQLPWIRHGQLKQFVEDYLANKHGDALAVWRLYTAWRWLDIFQPRITADVP